MTWFKKPSQMVNKWITDKMWQEFKFESTHNALPNEDFCNDMRGTRSESGSKMKIKPGVSSLYMSPVKSKPVICVSDQVRLKSDCTSTEYG